MKQLTRRRAVMLAAVGSIGGAGLTAGQGLRSESVSGQADVQAEQALTVNEVTVAGDADASFARVSDDNTEIQVAVEANNGDSFSTNADIDNASADRLSVRIQLVTPADIAIENIKNFKDVENVDENTETIDVVQSDTTEFVTNVDPGEGKFRFEFRIADTAAPGARNIEISINPLSTDNE